MMPETDGWTLAEQIRSDSRYEAIPLILLSSSTSNVRRERSPLSGPVRYLRKPVRPSELIESLLQSLVHKDSEASRTLNRSPSQPQRPLKILLAEDGLINQKVAVGLLAALGHQVTVAENGAAAVRAHEREPFDLILMDVEMPQMDGLEATAIIREREETSHRRTPIVAMTAHALKGDRERFLATGMDDYLSKPVDPYHLRQVIGRLTSIAELRNETQG
jgi:two-component system sensor kinase